MSIRILNTGAAMLLLLPLGLMGQGPSGNDISQAIPIYFGQTINDIGDSTLSPHRVFKVTLARGQSFSATVKATDGSANWWLRLLAPSATTVQSLTGPQVLEDVNRRHPPAPALTFTYQVAAAGTYYLYVQFYSTGENYTLQINATGTPIVVPNPTPAGCLSGKVDSVTYSLQLIAAELPDEVVIGGSRACATCTVKPPLYPEISSRLENALAANANVEACYDSAGNIFQLKLVRP